ncbi:MAG: exonuclease subunit SbcD [Thermacetogeniaceae bacterium]
MKILQTGDIHLGELPGPTINGENARMLDTVRCMDFVAEKAYEEQVDAILIAGDLFHRSKLWADQALKEIGLAVNWLRQLASIAPTILMFGTANHDNAQAFKTIESMHIPNLIVVTDPEIICLNTKNGPLQVAAVPGFDKGYFRAQYPGMDPTDENRICSNLLGDIILGLGADLDPTVPSVLISHYTVVGCQLDNGEHVFMQSDVVLPIEALAASPYDLVCLGHIHRRQSVQNCGRPVWYCGSINRLNFSEEGQTKGFLIHDIEHPDNLQFIDTPARWFTTVHAEEDSLTNWPTLFADDPCKAFDKYAREIDPCNHAIVRLYYGGDEETRKRMNHKAIEKSLYDAGAFYVSEIAPVKSEVALAKSRLNETAGPRENLTNWLQEQGLEAEEILQIIYLAEPLIAQVAASTPAGKLSGVFEPRRLEVKNYRSYKEESFDFSRISFATVNGPNGVGKSALFMDALCDCLYEEPREGDLAGWISNDEGAKSGSITFEFMMGDSAWRVVRTRAKSGKTTLTLQEYGLGDPIGAWIDRSGNTVRETQALIVALLGMDAMTFRCCALIMQDAYGLFMEADRADRMEVLGSILGLGVYEQLAELAKAQVTEINRSLQMAKAALAELDEKLKGRTEIHTVLAETEREIGEAEACIGQKEKQLQEAQDLVRKIEAKKEQVSKLREQRQSIAEEIANRDREKAGLDDQLAKARKILDSEKQIMEKCTELDRVKEQVTVLQTKAQQKQTLKNEYSNLFSESKPVSDEIGRLDPEIKKLEDLLANRAEYEQAATEYKDLSAKLEAMSELGKQDSTFHDQIMAVEKEIDSLSDAGHDKQLQIEACQKKTEMLSSSGCIDPGNARCLFLSDAQEASGRLPGLLDELKQIAADQTPFIQQVVDLEAAQAKLGYDSSKHYDLEQTVKALRPNADLAALLSAKAESLSNLRAHRQQLVRQQHQNSERMKTLYAELEALTEELKALPGLQERLPNLEKWAAGKDHLPAARQTITMATERIAAIDQETAAKTEQQSKIEAETEEIVGGLPVTMTAYTRDVQNLEDSVKSEQTNLNTLYVKKGALNSRLEALAKDEETRWGLAEQMEPQAKSLVRYQALAKAFGGDGIPFAVVRSVVGELSSMANEILGQMTGGKMAMEMKTERVQKSNHKEVNALEIWITDYMRGSLPYKSRSGGQKVKAALSVAFALADLKARRAGIQLGMMFVDEPPFLDSDGIEAYCDALELMSQRYPNMRVIAISHDPRMKARFPQQIDVEDMGEAGSKVRIA